jgi:predicted Ser/Thr protein kinase
MTSAPSSLGQLVLQEQVEWQSFVDSVGLGWQLLSISPADGDRRLFRRGNRLLKVRRIHEGRPQLTRQTGQTLEREERVLSHLAANGGENRNPVLVQRDDWESLEMDYVAGVPWTESWSNAGLLGRLSLLLSAARAISRLNGAGVFHGDIVSSNLVVSRRRVSLVDFGDAEIMSPSSARRREWTKLLLGKHGPIMSGARALVLRGVPFIQKVYRRFKLRRTAEFTIPNVPSDDWKLLIEAWRRAARWNSTRRQWLAYPSLTIDGYHLPGLRPWLLRWLRIEQSVDFRGKKLLDLGCNLGMLASFATLAGAEKAHGVDKEEHLVEAAILASRGLGASATFESSDFDSSQPLEERWHDFDIVVALSIVEWVSDRDRFLQFLGRHSEVLYEGHDSVQTEVDRITAIGFTDIRVVMFSEVGRALLHGRKSVQ